MVDSKKPKSSSKPKDSKKKGYKTKNGAKAAEEASDPPKPIDLAKLPDAKPKKKKQKITPVKPQPSWLFPSYEDVSDPHHLMESERGKDLENWNAAVNFLKHKAATAPLKTPPPSQLLTLVGKLLTSIGFDSASRVFIVERNARKMLDGWDNESGEDALEKGLPDLIKIYNDWYKGWQARKELDRSRYDEKRSAIAKQSEKVPKKQKVESGKVVGKADETSSSSSNDSSSASSSENDSDVEMADVTPGEEESKTMAEVDTSSETSSSSDSGTEDKKETTKIAAKAAITIPKKPAVNGQVKTSKRKASSISSSASDNSSSDTSSSDIEAKKEASTSSSSSSDTSSSDSESDIVSSKIPIPASTSASNPSPSSSSSDSDSDTKPVSKPFKSSKISTSKPITNSRKSSTDTSVTLPKGTTTNTPPLKRKRSLSPYSKRLPAMETAKKSANEPFRRVPKDTIVDVKLASNAYVPYDYAERAHRDLIRTKGKDFSKEKNKKKRGSYRGGMIDVDGRKGIKFED